MPKVYYEAKRGLPAGSPRPPGIARSKYRPELGAAICRRIAAGEPVTTICADLAMPCAKSLWRWARRRPEFALMLRHARDTARAAALARSLAAEAAAVAATQANWRPGWKGKPCRYSEYLVAEICFRLSEGEPMEAICRDPSMPGKTTVYRWLRREPFFRAEYRIARDVAVELMVDTARESSPWTGTYGGSMRVLNRRVRDAERRAARLAPQHYTPRATPKALVVTLEEPDGRQRVIYSEGGPNA